jgi:hypothetical protein
MVLFNISKGAVRAFVFFVRDAMAFDRSEDRIGVNSRRGHSGECRDRDGGGAG